MTDYGTLGLDNNLRPVDSPAKRHGTARTTGYEFNSQNERDAITATNIRNFSFSTGKGGTLTLGGTTNGNGLMELRDASGSLIFTGDNTGHHYYNALGTEQVKVDHTGFHAYGSAGTSVEQVRADNTGFRVFGTSGFICSFLNGGTVNDTLFFGADNSGTIYLQTAVGIPIVFSMNSGCYFAMSPFNTGTLNINGALKVNYGTALTQGTITANLNGTATYANALVGGGGTVDYAYNAGTASYATNAGDIGFDNITAFWSGTNIVLQHGTDFKTAIVPTSKGYNALYTNESPEVWFMDFCESKDKIDPMFLEVTEKPYRFIKCEDENGKEMYQVWGIRKGAKKIRFTPKTKKEFEKNSEFWSTPMR